MSISLTSEGVLCNGGNSGSISIVASGGTPNYQYSINGGVDYFANSTFSGLTADNYLVSVRDTNGCAQSQGIVIQEPQAPVEANVSNLQNVLCRNDSTGSVSFEVTGGTGSYTYSIDDGQNWQISNTFSDLPFGSYSVLMSDVNGCLDSFAFNINQPPVELGIDTVTYQDVLCNGDSTGQIVVTPQGGTPVYNYSINGGDSYQTQNTFNNLPAGTYNVVLRDFNGCMRTQDIELTEASQLVLSLVNANDPVCEDDTTGVISVFASGGTTPYEYSINGGGTQSNPVFGGLTPDNYQISVIDSNGCSTSLPVLMEFQNDLPVADFSYNIAGNSVAFNNNSSFNLENEWDFGDGTTSTEVNPIHTFSGDGPHSVTLTVSNVCGEDSVTIQVSTTSIADLSNQDDLISVYPNPSMGEFLIEFNGELNLSDVELRISDINGRVLSTEQISAVNSPLRVIKPELSNGIYMLSVNGKEFNARKVIVINR